MVVDYSPELNFWEANPQMTVLGPFSKLYNGGKAKKRTSQVAWGVFLFAETSDRSLFARYEIEEKKKAVTEEFGVDFDDDVHNECVSFYQQHVLTPIEKQLLNTEKFLYEIDEFLMSQEMSADNITTLVKAKADSKRIWDDYFRIKEQFDKEKNKKAYGNVTLSLTEQNQL